MNLISILTVLWYTIQPWLWLILLVIAVLLFTQTVARLKGYRMDRQPHTKAIIISLVVGVAAIFIVPIVTGSALAYVVTVFDWLALILVAVGVAVYSWLIIHPLLYLGFHNEKVAFGSAITQ